ncbi:hypothetical protein CD33_01980 [Ureibacillus sinduriensis BLB-1 = JCM 15800]|uniref:Uncharacterized protein n=1 Tax=Ureibacillus sinduriensis BLB-1 = JCM 15800 TaxID=1384057 RepID=A0A0A3I5K4_9BACL|nr:hypothetical protein CD33_01980 [Ureibacillus sinduriensis BLB-1 = JCM 15800]
MESTILMYIMLFLSQLFTASLVLAIITSVIVKNRKKGILFLTIYLFLILYSLTTGFKFSTIMGSGMLIIYISLGILTYFIIKNKLSKGTAI